MRVALAGLVCMVGCGFRSTATGSDAGTGGDSSVVPDAPADTVVPDAAPAARTRAGLMGLWALDELDGSTGAMLQDTGDGTPKVPLTITAGTATFSAGRMTLNSVAVIASGPAPHFNADVKASQAVALEAWVMAGASSQGTLLAPAVVAGLCSSINARNISILQAGKRWVARVRTTVDGNGGPDLISTVDIAPGVMTHLVVVADATHRILYVDGKADATDPLPGPPLAWDKSYKMSLGDELSRNRPWAGTFALVAIYRQALSDALVQANFLAGPDAP